MGIIKLKNSKSEVRNQKHGFTLIEIIVVIATIGLVLPAIFAIVFTILQQQIKIQRFSIVKREGDYVLDVMENVIRNYAQTIHSMRPPDDSNKICQTPTTENASYFKDKFGNWFRFYLNSSNKIASESSVIVDASGQPQPIDLNSSKTKVTNFVIQCYSTASYSPPVVNISFTIEYNTSSSRPEEKASLNYQTKVKLRSY